MKILGLMVVKNEADIIELSLSYNVRLFDKIYVLDNGSTDDTWEIINDFSLKNSSIVPFKKDFSPFRDSLRSLIFNKFKDEAKPDDWWCRLDSDEFYIQNPRDFLKNVPKYHHVVWGLHLQYYFTEKDIERLETTEGTFIKADFSNLPRYYRANASETRFFRHRNRLIWNTNDSWPIHLGIVHPKRILLKHYQYRSAMQVNIRLKSRIEAAIHGYQNFGHAIQSNWREKIMDSKELYYDDGSGNYIIHEKDLPLHLEKWDRRLFKYLMHGFKIWA